MDKISILIVDDEQEIRELVRIYLMGEGFQVFEAKNGIEALTILEKERIQLILLDIMMPELNGIHACIKIRENNNMPIIMLSAKDQDTDKILGLSTGADDYIAKPFNPLELVARVKSQLRRYTKFGTESINTYSIEINGLSIRSDKHLCFVDENEIKLTPREFAILELLARNRGIVFSIDRIYEAVWQEKFASDNTVMVHIRKIREKIETDPRKPRFIKTVWGVGYKID